MKLMRFTAVVVFVFIVPVMLAGAKVAAIIWAALHWCGVKLQLIDNDGRYDSYIHSSGSNRRV